MNPELVIIRAQLSALRAHYIHFIESHSKKDVWLHKYVFWDYERYLISFYASEYDHISDQSQKLLDRRRYQLQVLCDIACIVGNLDMDRLIPPESRRIALDVYNRSDGSEEGMIPLIDEYY